MTTRITLEILLILVLVIGNGIFAMTELAIAKDVPHAAIAALAVLTLAGERRSLGAVIEATPVLRELDALPLGLHDVQLALEDLHQVRPVLQRLVNALEATEGDDVAAVHLQHPMAPAIGKGGDSRRHPIPDVRQRHRETV